MGDTVGLCWALQYSGTRPGGVAVGTAIHGHPGYAGYTRVVGTHRGTGGYYAGTRSPNPTQPTPHPLPSQKCSSGIQKKCRQVHLDRDSVPTTAKGVSPTQQGGGGGGGWDTCGMPVAFAWEQAGGCPMGESVPVTNTSPVEYPEGTRYLGRELTPLSPPESTPGELGT